MGSSGVLFGCIGEVYPLVEVLGVDGVSGIGSFNGM